MLYIQFTEKSFFVLLKFREVNNENNFLNEIMHKLKKHKFPNISISTINNNTRQIYMIAICKNAGYWVPFS